MPKSRWLASLLALAPACASSEPDTLAPPPASGPPVTLERAGFRLVHPASWKIDADAPGHDPEHFFLLEGPDHATIAFLLLDEPADPKALVREMTAEHGLLDVSDRAFTRWGRYEGFGIDLRGVNAADVPAGMRAFAWSDGERSFLVAETYVEYGYAAARAGFDAVERTFQLHGDTPWPAISLGTPDEETDERLLVRRAFELRFPAGWRVDATAEGYDPDAFFTLVSPYESAWLVIQLVEGDFDADKLLADAREGLQGVLSAVESERELFKWGRLDGAGVELAGRESNLPSVLRVFVHVGEGRALIATEFRYDELAARIDPDLGRIAESFEFRD